MRDIVHLETPKVMFNPHAQVSGYNGLAGRGGRGDGGKHQERPICLPVSLSGLHWAASNACQDCPWSWLRLVKTTKKCLDSVLVMQYVLQ